MMNKKRNEDTFADNLKMPSIMKFVPTVALNASRMPVQDLRSLSALLGIHSCDAYPRFRHDIVDTAPTFAL